MCWVADTGMSKEVLINGLRRGVPPKHRFNEKFRPLLSKISIFALYRSTQQALGLPLLPETTTYYATKQSVTPYQAAKQVLHGPSAPFAGWIRSGAKWESFDPQGTVTDVDPLIQV